MTISPNIKILVADDDPAVLDVFRKVLSTSEFNSVDHPEAETFGRNDAIPRPPLSFDLVTCRQGPEAVDAVKRSVQENRPFSVAFIDIRMPPGPDGIWSAEQIRRLDDNVEILIMTGYSDVHPLDIARRVPPVHKLLYVQKPFHLREIYQFASALSMKWYTECELQKLNKFLEQCVEDRIQEVIIINKVLQNKLVELQKTRSALQENEGKLDAMIGSISDHISMLDKDLNIIWANNTAMEIFGEGIIGKKCYEAYHRRKEPCEPYPCLTLKAFEDGQVHKQEIEAIDKNGNMRFFHCTANVAIRDENRNPTAVMEVSRDITERKQAEEALWESEKKYRRLFESLVDVFYQTDSFGKITMVSPSITKAAGYKPEEVIGSYLNDYYVTPDERNKFLELISTNGFVENFEVQMKKKDGSVLWASVSAGLSKDQEGNVIGVEGIARDITKRINAEKELREARDELKNKVDERTAELDDALKTIKGREKELIQRKSALEILNRELLETNQAVTVLARNIDRKKEELERKVYEVCSGKIMPILKNLQKDAYCKKREADLELILNYLNGIVHETPLVHDITSHLTEQEMRVAMLIKNGLTSQQIADSLCLSVLTVKTHRRNIRKKLNIENESINLASYLKSRLKYGPIQESELP